MKNPEFFSITIFTKPYLKKFLLNKFSNPQGTAIRFTTADYFGMTIAAYIERPLEIHRTKQELRCRCDRYTVELKIELPKTFLTKRTIGFEISDASTITINKLMETLFSEELHSWCKLGVIYNVEFKKNLEDFCHRQKIEIDEDITYEALKKKEYRFRVALMKEAAKKSEKSFPPFVPQKMVA